MNGLSASPLSNTFSFSSHNFPRTNPSCAITPLTTFSFSSRNFPKTNLSFNNTTASTVLCRHGLPCRLSSGSGGTTSGENESKNAFFLGKALVETVNERLESAVREFLVEVFERAKKIKEQTPREAQVIIPKASTVSGTSSSLSAANVSKTSPSIVRDVDASNLLSYSNSTATNSDSADRSPL